MKSIFDKDNFRYERKFVVPYLDKNEVEAVILSNSFLFSEIFYERQINNIYFDSLDMPSFFDNILGNTDRVKVRIRWYGEFEEIKNPVLELKIRRGFVGTKLLFPLKDFSFPISLEKMYQIFAESNLPNWLNEKLKNQRFALINYYSRRYFMSACGKFRITIDSNLTYGEVLAQNNLYLFKTMKEPHCILELKYNIDKNAENVATQFPFRLTKSSKFVSGIIHFRGE